MSDHRQADRFIKSLAKELNNKKIDIDHSLFNYIYHRLLLLSVPTKDRNHNLNEEGLFKNWCKVKRERTNSFVTPSWTYCCQFVSKDNKALRKDNHLKVYIPLDFDHIEKGVNEIIDFLDENHISHLSRVGQRISNNSVLIHLINEEDLNKLLTFIKENSYLQEGLIKPNPFLYNEGNIALTVDGNISYNQTVANYLLLYLKKLREHNALEEASLKGFYRFVINYYALTFVDERNPERPFVLNNFSRDFSYVDNKPIDVSDDSVLSDYQEVTKLIMESQAKDFKLTNFVKHFNGVNEAKKDEEVIVERANNMLTTIVERMIEKGDSNYSTWNIIKYIETGEPIYLTKFGDTRNMVANSSFYDDIMYTLRLKRLSAQEYVTQFYNKMFVLDDEVIELLKEYIAYGEFKYGLDDTREYLGEYLATLNDAYITRDSNFRERFKEVNLGNRLRLYMKATGYNLDTVIDNCRPIRI